MPSGPARKKLNVNAAFVACVLDQVVEWMREQGFVVNHVPTTTESLSPVLAPFCPNAHMTFCSKCGFVGVIRGLPTPISHVGSDEDANLDLTDPNNLSLASTRQIRTMASNVRATLMPLVTVAHRSLLDIPRLAALNPLNQVVPFLGDDHAPMSVPELHAWIDEEDGTKHITTKHSPNDRYYLIVRGLKFTGVVRGSYLNTIYAAHGVSQGGAPAMNFRADAEFAWLCYFYGGKCARIVNAVIQPEVPVFV